MLAAPAHAAPARIMSLGLCTDELLLLLADASQIASISYLGKQAEETPLAARARGVPANRGTAEEIVATGPDLVVTGGAVNRRARALAERLGYQVLDLPPPGSLAELETSVMKLARRLGHPRRGERLIKWMRARLAAPPERSRAALLLHPGGLAGWSGGLAAELLSYAGLNLVDVPGGRVDREALLARPPEVLLTTNYRKNQFSMAQSWPIPDGPWARLELDGRLWTCPSPLAAAEVERLREASAE